VKSEKVPTPRRVGNFQNKGRGVSSREENTPIAIPAIKGLTENVKQTMQNNVDASIQRQQGLSNAPRILQRECVWDCKDSQPWWTLEQVKKMTDEQLEKAHEKQYPNGPISRDQWIAEFERRGLEYFDWDFVNW